MTYQQLEYLYFETPLDGIGVKVLPIIVVAPLTFVEIEFSSI